MQTLKRGRLADPAERGAKRGADQRLLEARVRPGVTIADKVGLERMHVNRQRARFALLCARAQRDAAPHDAAQKLADRIGLIRYRLELEFASEPFAYPPCIAIA